MVQLIFVRHGQPEWVRDGRSSNDPPLTELGRLQAEAAAAHLAASATPSTELVVSPLRRAIETAAPIAEALGLTPTVEPWLAEIAGPEWWDGSPAEEVEEMFRTARHRALDELWEGLPGGESFRAFHARVTEGVEGFLDRRGAARVTPEPPQWRFPEPTRRIVVVAHAGTNATVIGHLLGIPPVPWEWERFVTLHASLSELHPIEVGGASAYSLVRLSDVGHLDPADRTR